MTQITQDNLDALFKEKRIIFGREFSITRMLGNLNKEPLLYFNDGNTELGGTLQEWYSYPLKKEEKKIIRSYEVLSLVRKEKNLVIARKENGQEVHLTIDGWNSLESV